MNSVKKGGILHRLFINDNKKPLPETIGGGMSQEVLNEIIKASIETETKKMDAMSRLELIQYAAEMRAYLVYAFTLLTESAEVIKDLQKVSAVTVDTVNKVIKKHSVKPMDYQDYNG